MTAQKQVQETPIIPARSGDVTVLCAHAFLAMLVGLALRLLFAFRFPGAAGDSEIYLELSRNWADHHVYGLWLNGQLVPTDLRTPGYPAFLAGIAILLGRSTRAIVLSQVAVDLGTCLLTAALSATLVPVASQRRVAIAALWLAATCPFVANYSAVVLTETLTTFLAMAALLCFTAALGPQSSRRSLMIMRWTPTSFALASLGSFLTGLATLVRPEMPLLLVVAGVVYLLRWWKFLSPGKRILTLASMAVAFILPLAPWVGRNLITLHEFQPVAPRYATLPGEYAPVGYFAWTKTWLERYRDVYLNVWKIGEEPVEIEDLPPQAFDSPQEKARIAKMFQQYNDSPDLDISPELDREFAGVARQRTRRHPLRTYFQVPLERALTIWFTPRTELLPIDGKLWPVREQWQDSHAAFLTTATFGFLDYVYVALALGGIWVLWRTGGSDRGSTNFSDTPNLWGLAFLIGYLVVRTAFVTTVEAPEPRYVITCYPVVLALVAMLRREHQERTN